MTDRTIRIGGASGYWGDTAIGVAQMLGDDAPDYLMFDYLAEITMSILAKAKSRDADSGYATDFITRVMKPFLNQIADKRIKVIANAGGVNLQACRRALEAVAAEAGVDLKIGTVEGDDLMPMAERLRADDVREMGTGEALPERLMSMNAYLGAFPIAAALDAGADIVITGRCVDSALAAGPLIHEFGWQPDDYDRLAAAGLVGHIIECGAQASGGNFSDWEDTQDGWENTGFPIAEVSADGRFVLTKPAGTGGLVSPLTAAEQMLYEIGDPGAYVLPDVICDFTAVTMAQQGPDRVAIGGARGREPTSTYKVSATYLGGFGCVGNFVVAGRDAAHKAQRQADALLNKSRAMLEQQGLGDYQKSAIQIIGTEAATYGAQARPEAGACREVVLRLAVRHAQREALELFSKEFVGAALSMAPGLTALAPGRPKVTPVVRLFSFLLDKNNVDVQVALDGQPIELAHAVTRGAGEPEAGKRSEVEDTAPAEGESMEVPLLRLAVARSGDKGDDANIGVIAREPRYLSALRAALSAERVHAYFGHVVRGEVERFDLPGVHAMNFLLHEALDGGGVASLNLDPQAKTYAQALLDMPVTVPATLLDEHHAHDEAPA
jgi:hypothetical protein